MPLDLNPIEACLARDVHQYFRGERIEAERCIGTDLEYLLTGLWESRPLPIARWFDGLVDSTFTTQNPRRLNVKGLMYWATPGKDTGQWVDVFSAELRARENGQDLSGYTVRFGRKGLEQRRVLYEARNELVQELEHFGSLAWAWEAKKSF